MSFGRCQCYGIDCGGSIYDPSHPCMGFEKPTPEAVIRTVELDSETVALGISLGMITHDGHQYTFTDKGGEALRKWCNERIKKHQPATRIGRTIIFKGGHTRRLGIVEYLLIRLGLKSTTKGWNA